MPIHDLGYRACRPSATAMALRWWVITLSGIRVTSKSSWLRRMLALAWLPAAVIAFAFFAYEQSLTLQGARYNFASFVAQVLQHPLLAMALREDPAQARHEIWSLLLLTFFRYPQGVLMVLMVGMIAPRLIAQDIRSRAFLVYFSRPLTPWEYVLGKSVIVWGYLSFITTLPALALYVLGVLLSPSVNVVLYTWDLPLRILAASLVLIVPTTSLALCFSSLTSESRYAGFGWFAVWVLGWVSYSLLTLVGAAAHGDFAELFGHQWTLLSLYHTLGQVQSWVFGLHDSFREVFPSAILLILITWISLLVLVRRVSSPMRI